MSQCSTSRCLFPAWAVLVCSQLITSNRRKHHLLEQFQVKETLVTRLVHRFSPNQTLSRVSSLAWPSSPHRKTNYRRTQANLLFSRFKRKLRFRRLPRSLCRPFSSLPFLERVPVTIRPNPQLLLGWLESILRQHLSASSHHSKMGARPRRPNQTIALNSSREHQLRKLMEAAHRKQGRAILQLRESTEPGLRTSRQKI